MLPGVDARWLCVVAGAELDAGVDAAESVGPVCSLGLLCASCRKTQRLFLEYRKDGHFQWCHLSILSELYINHVKAFIF